MSETIRGFRLSRGQRRLWLAGGRAATLCAQGALSISGDCTAEKLKNALGELIDTHESLRTVFRARAGMAVPIQVVEPQGCRPQWQEFDCTDLAAEARTGCWREHLRRQGQEPFDFEQAPLVRASWLRFEPRLHVLLLTLPTLCADRRSIGNLMADLAGAYAAQESEDVAQFVHFSEWEHEFLADGAERQAYWSRQRLEALPTLRLPFQRASRVEARTAGESLASGQRGHVRVTLEPGRVARLEEAARKLESPFESLLLACYAILLWRTTRQERIVVAPVVDGRWFAELESAVGLFARALPLGLNLRWEDRFEGVVVKLRQSLEEALEAREYSPPNEEAGPAVGDPFALGFEFDRRPAPSEVGGLRFALLEQRAALGRAALEFRAIEEGIDGNPSLTFELGFDADVFAEADVKVLADQLVTLAAAAATEPRSTIEALPLVAEPDSLLACWRGSKASVSPGKGGEATLHSLFEAQAQRVPERVAVRYEATELRFAELNAWANALAHFLRRRGVGPEVPVAICLDRSLEMVLALLGVLKAGGVFVPLVPDLPRERLEGMLSQLGTAMGGGPVTPPVVLTRSELVGGLAEGAGLAEGTGRQVLMDADWDAIARCGNEDPAPLASAGNLAYIVFTSGTTGQPKGVMIEHRQLRSYIDAIVDRLELPADASFAMVSTFAADLGYTMLFPSLTRGGTLHVIAQDRASDPEALAEYFAQHAIDGLKITPGHLAALRGGVQTDGAQTGSAEPGSLLPRQRLVLGGEALQPAPVAEMRATAPDCEIFNHYGPTETTIGATTFRVPAGRSGDWQADERRSTVPIGRPLANARIYLVDREMRPVPAWISGEILIGGAGVCRGYLGRAARTAESVIPDAWSGEPGARLYRTGDLARHADGELEFLGRRDHQVKFHGFRVELEEIRGTLSRDPRIRECVVRKVEDSRGHATLVVYYAARQELPVTELRQILGRSLPEDILPNVFIHLASLPYTPNGKIDVAALPGLEEARERQRKQFVAPRNPVEAQLTAIWASVLGLERVGIHDNYFEIGGDSIQSIRVIAQASRAGIRLKPPQFFEQQTVAELATVVELAGAAGTGGRLPADADRGPATGEVPLTPIQRRFFEQDHREPHHWNLSLRLEVRPEADVRFLARAFAHLIAQHDALRLRFNREAGTWRQRYSSAAGPAPFVHIDVSNLDPRHQPVATATAAADIEASLDLQHGPLARGACFAWGDGLPRRLHLIFHHLVVDGVSWRILLEDFATAYRHLNRGEHLDSVPRTSSFKSWAEALVEHAKDPKLGDEMSRWLGEQSPSVATLPLDAPGGGNTEGCARTVVTSLSPEETRDLLQEAPKRCRAQVEEILLLALARALAEWTGQRCFRIDLEGHGREDVPGTLDLSRTVGWFTSVTPLTFHLDESGDTSTDLQAVKEQRRAVPGQGLAYGLHRYLDEDSDLSGRLRQLPPAEIGFNYMGQLDRLIDEPFSLIVGAENFGAQRSVRAPRLHLLAVNCWVFEGGLHVGLTYSESLHRRETLTALGQGVARQLRSILQLDADVVVDSPADFPLANLDQEALQKVAGLLSSLDESE